MDTLLRIAAITDEFSPDLEQAADAMAAIGMTGAELRVVFAKNVLDLSDQEVESAKAIVESYGLEVIALSSPLLKCVLPDSPPVDARFQHDIFASSHTYEDQPRLTKRAFEIAHKTGARVIRVFSYWRTEDPEQCFDRIAEALRCLARKGSQRGPHRWHRKRSRLQHFHGRGSSAGAQGGGTSEPQAGLGRRERLRGR